jgi:hypothetical protein
MWVRYDDFNFSSCLMFFLDYGISGQVILIAGMEMGNGIRSEEGVRWVPNTLRLRVRNLIGFFIPFFLFLPPFSISMYHHNIQTGFVIP